MAAELDFCSNVNGMSVILSLGPRIQIPYSSLKLMMAMLEISRPGRHSWCEIYGGIFPSQLIYFPGGQRR